MSDIEPRQAPPAEEREAQEAQARDPEVLPRAERRQFTGQYKLRSLEEVERCTERGQVGALLRREGLCAVK
jgi:hypothetical protein